ncbi:hypothetical protein M3573_20640, partial [Bacillus safensis]
QSSLDVSQEYRRLRCAYALRFDAGNLNDFISDTWKADLLRRSCRHCLYDSVCEQAVSSTGLLPRYLPRSTRRQQDPPFAGDTFKCEYASRLRGNVQDSSRSVAAKAAVQDAQNGTGSGRLECVSNRCHGQCGPGEVCAKGIVDSDAPIR